MTIVYLLLISLSLHTLGEELKNNSNDFDNGDDDNDQTQDSSSAGDCADGTDNGCVGRVDCLDDGCVNKPVCTEADADQDDSSAAEDCDDNNPNSTSIAQDADFDGILWGGNQPISLGGADCNDTNGGLVSG